MEKLYGALFEDKGVPEAIRLGRKKLHDEKNRRVYFNQVVALEDWLLPVVYVNGEVDLRLVPLSGQAKAEALMVRGRRYRFEEPTYGFVGRDLEILKIEKALLRHNALLLRGMGGTGKTTLLNYLREWWQTTGFAREVFYFGYDEHAYTLQQMLREMGKRLYAEGYEFNEFEAMPVEAQAMDVADRLRAEPYQQMIRSKDPEQRKLGLFFCGLEYENLFSALQTCLAQQGSISIYGCLDTYLDTSNNSAGKLQLAELVKSAKAGYSEEDLQGQAGWEFADALLKLGNSYLTTQQYPLARTTCQDALDLLKNVVGVEPTKRQLAVANITHQLGRAAQELREYKQARSYYQQALDIKIRCDNRYSQAGTYHQLGRVAQELREYKQARSHYQQALDIYIEYGDRYSQASAHHQLGMVAQELREYEQAKSHYQQTIDICTEYGDRYNQARVYDNLGVVMQDLREYEQARRYYQQADQYLH